MVKGLLCLWHCLLIDFNVITVRNEVAKVMFLQVCVCPQGGVSASVHAGGRSQNTVPIASTQVAIKGIVQYSTSKKTSSSSSIGEEQLATRHSREHTLSAVSPDAPVE